MAHGVIRTDLMEGTESAPELRSVMYKGSGSTNTAIDNGCVVLLDGLLTGEREVWKAVTPAANSPLKSVAVIATPEVMYDERKHNLEDFENEAGKIARAYLFHTHGIYSVTADCLTIADGATPAVGWVIELAASVKPKLVETLTSGSTQIGKLIQIEDLGIRKYYVIQID